MVIDCNHGHLSVSGFVDTRIGTEGRNTPSLRLDS